MSKAYNSSARLAIPVSAYYKVNSSDFGGIQPSIPTGYNETLDWYITVSNQFRVQKPVVAITPAGTLDPAGVVVGRWVCVAPDDPGRSTAITSGSNTYMLINSFLYLCTTSGTTAAAFPTLVATAGSTTTDGTATWTCQGRKGLVVAAVSFTIQVSPAQGPVAQEYDFAQL